MPKAPRTGLPRQSFVRFLVAVTAALIVIVVARDVRAQSPLERYDQYVCKDRGGVRGIGRAFSYLPFFTKWPLVNSSSPCIQNCPQCIQYCYAYTLNCNDGVSFARYTQTQPFVSPSDEHPTYTSETQEAVEWARVQAQQASVNFWRPLSPYPQILILCGFIAISGLAWFGRDKNGTGIKDWYLNVPLNLYFAVSLLTFNTSGDSDNLAQGLDGTVFFHSSVFIIGVCAFLAFNAISLVRGWDYLFIKHPAADIVNSAVGSGAPIDRQALAQALRTNPKEITELRPAWHYQHQAEKARKLSEKLDRDAELARAAIARERARAEFQEQKEPSADEIREQVLRGRTLR